MKTSKLTVFDVLKRKHFEHIQIAAGHQGLNRTVKWVHVVEVTKISNLLKGKELILSTGVGWKENKSLFISFVRQLIECDASGLCIEIGTYASSIPQEVIDLANEHQFPIILFLKEVPFVEITQDIHTYLINQHYQIISNLESYSQELNKKLLSVDHYDEILKFLHHYLGHQVIFRINGKEVELVPKYVKRSNEKQQQFDSALRPQQKIASQSIRILGNEYAELSIVSIDKEINEFDLLILDRTATALAQHLLRDLYVEEKKRAQEHEWLKDWLEGEHTSEAIFDYLTDHETELRPKGGFVSICRFKSSKQYLNLDITYFKLLCRTIFEQQGFSTFPVDFRNSVVFIMVNKRDIKTWKNRMKMGIKYLLKSDFVNKKRVPKFLIGVGKFVENLSHMDKSYRTALETIKIQNQLGKKANSNFYEDLHIYRIISLIHKCSDLYEVVMEYLEPVIQHDKKYNGKLMETLKVYLECNGSKKETAKRLFVVRQTLYHRIQKLEKLLGDDFMNPEKRLAIEFMIKAYEYLMPNNETQYVQNDLQR
ncbi:MULTISPECIES: PucR family transcriptional regulator [Parageobacillus]|jgi:PucR family transcriptional regulator, purine catabolism regulatory protein|uniref:PucR family transcriptional regulator n=1 Tax=Parageobacillus thermoglucosidasius TaxID=1426 RepID=A0A1B7KT18_PARTM|nr:MULTISPECIES: PucR family transcriptional regulator [Parageobacillus]OAT73198.1 PucR family transcriptional regulator [Parageobacillus thermoglucosidasius]BDG47862.1 PucR family transcriptional regulator [Parageobacillus sp. KH3-4]